VLGVERRDRGDLGAGEAEDLGAQRDAAGADVAVLGLDEVQHREQRGPGLRVARDDLGGLPAQALLRLRCVAGDAHQRSTPPRTGSSEASVTTTSASWPPSLMIDIDCRLEN